MLDLQYICDNADAVRENCERRGVKVDLEKVLALRGQRSESIQLVDQKRKDQKEVSGKIPKASAEDKPKFIAEGKQLREEISEAEAKLKEIEAELFAEQSRIPMNQLINKTTSNVHFFTF